MILKDLWKAISSLWTKKVDVAVAPVAPLAGAATGTTQTTTVTETPAEIADADLSTAITIVNNVKAALASTVAVLITDLIPGTVDDTIREELVNDLPVIAASLANIKSFVNTADKSTQINDILAQIRLSPNMDMDAFEHALAARVLGKLTTGGITWSVAVMAVEYFLKNIFKSPAAQVDVPPAAAPALPGAAEEEQVTN